MFQIKKKKNLKRPQIPNHAYIILIIGGSGSEKTNSLLNLINQNSRLIKFIDMLRIHMEENRNFRLKNTKVQS